MVKASLVYFVLTSILPFTLAAPQCLRFADYDSINRLLTSGGPGTIINLCPGRTYRLSGPIIFTAADQLITTLDAPTDHNRAILRVQGGAETAIRGDCRRCKGIRIENLIIDGNRRKLGRSKPDEEAQGLIVIGGNSDQVVKDCLIRDPRGLTAIHIKEGDKLQCSNISILNNIIGPVGEEYDPSVDGSDPETSPLGRPLGDGLTLACRDSIVSGNTFIDNTDAGIVIYCSPGSTVTENIIQTQDSTAMAGILMVDATPFDSDYTGLSVTSNTIQADNYIRVGIGIGPTVWSDDTETFLQGGKVTNNLITGSASMGYGIAAAGIRKWTIEGNEEDILEYTGKRGERCFPEFRNPDPTAFLFNQKSIKGSGLQDGFVDQEFMYVVCVDPLGPGNERQVKPVVEKKGKAQKIVRPKRPQPEEGGVQIPAIPKKIPVKQADTGGKANQKARKKRPDPPPKVIHNEEQDIEDDDEGSPSILDEDEEPSSVLVEDEEVDLEDDTATGVAVEEEDEDVLESHSKTIKEIKAEEPIKFDTGSDVMDGILTHSQARLTEIIGKINNKLDSLVDTSSAGDEAVKVRKKQGLDTSKGGNEGVLKRIDSVEKDHTKMLNAMKDLKESMKKGSQANSKEQAWELEILLDIQNQLHNHFDNIHPSPNTPISPGDHHDPHSSHDDNQAILDIPHSKAGKESKLRSNLRAKSEKARLRSSSSSSSSSSTDAPFLGIGWGRLIFWLFGGSVILGIWKLLSPSNEKKRRESFGNDENMGMVREKREVGVGIGKRVNVAESNGHGMGMNGVNGHLNGTNVPTKKVRDRGWWSWIKGESHRKEM